jgi:hypothetical protein
MKPKPKIWTETDTNGIEWIVAGPIYPKGRK